MVCFRIKCLTFESLENGIQQKWTFSWYFMGGSTGVVENSFNFKIKKE